MFEPGEVPQDCSKHISLHDRNLKFCYRVDWFSQCFPSFVSLFYLKTLQFIPVTLLKRNLTCSKVNKLLKFVSQY